MVSKVAQRSFFLKAAMLVCLFISTVIPTRSHAALITSDFSGTVLSVNSLFSSTFSVGQTLTGLYAFESTTPPAIGSDSAVALFNAVTAINISFDGYNASSTEAFIEINSGLNGAPHDLYGVGIVSGLTGPDVDGFSLLAFGSRLDDPTNSVFTTALALPTSLDFSDFTSSAFFLFFQDPQTSSSVLALSGELTDFNVPTVVQAVPEPCTMALLGVGFAGAALARKRRTQ